MTARDESRFSSGVSVHYRGANDFVKYWLARPDKFSPSIYMVDDVTGSSTVAEMVTQAVMGDIKRQAAITYQGEKFR